MICPRCGKDSSGAFCIVCGTRLAGSARDELLTRQMDIPSLYRLLERDLSRFAPLAPLYEQLAKLQAKEAPGKLRRFFRFGRRQRQDATVLGGVFRTAGIACLVFLGASKVIVALHGAWAGVGALLLFLAVVTLAAVLVPKYASMRNRKRIDDLVARLAEHYRAQPDAVVPFEYSNPSAISQMMGIARAGRATSVSECVKMLERDIEAQEQLESKRDDLYDAKRSSLAMIGLTILATRER